MKKVLLLSLTVAVAAVVAFMASLMRSPYRVGMRAKDINPDIGARSLKEFKQGGFQFSRIHASGRSGLLELWTNYHSQKERVFLQRWHTCKLDTNGVIVEVESDWVWKGLKGLP